MIDLQDIGTRFYTYMTTMAYVMEEAAARKIKVVVLDRPNPIGGVQIEGPALDEAAVGFTGYLPAMPIRHGLTMGELAQLFNGEKKIGADLTVVAMQQLAARRVVRRDRPAVDQPVAEHAQPARRRRSIRASARSSRRTSRSAAAPTRRSSTSARRGSTAPRLAEALNARQIPGVRFYPVRFTPTSSKFANEECQGVFIVITDRARAAPGARRRGDRVGARRSCFRASSRSIWRARLFGSTAGLDRIKAGDDPAAIAASWSGGEARWRLLRAKYLIY